MGSIHDFNGSQLITIRRTVAKDTNDTEFDLFMNAARSYGLDPFRKQISAIVFNKDKPDKRQMAIIVGRDGLRSIAQRCGDYRPASEPPKFEYDESLKGPHNPKADEFGGLYVEEEMQAAQMKDVTPSEPVREEEEANRQALLGDKSILFSFNQNTGFERIPVGQVADRCMEFIKNGDAESVYSWSVQNREPLRDFWTASPDDALAVKKQIEEKVKDFNPAEAA